jgi:hypothetical protein
VEVQVQLAASLDRGPQLRTQRRRPRPASDQTGPQQAEASSS